MDSTGRAIGAGPHEDLFVVRDRMAADRTRAATERLARAPEPPGAGRSAGLARPPPRRRWARRGRRSTRGQARRRPPARPS